MRNIAGVIGDQFQIGFDGCSLLVGEGPPQPHQGDVGDIFIHDGLFSKTPSGWLRIAQQPDPIVDSIYRGTVFEARGVVIVRRNPFTADSIDVTADALVTVDNHPADETTVYLPIGDSGERVVVKDVTSNPSEFPIRLLGTSLIDDSSDLEIVEPRSVVELIFSGDQWRRV